MSKLNEVEVIRKNVINSIMLYFFEKTINFKCTRFKIILNDYEYLFESLSKEFKENNEIHYISLNSKSIYDIQSIEFFNEYLTVNRITQYYIHGIGIHKNRSIEMKYEDLRYIAIDNNKLDVELLPDIRCKNAEKNKIISKLDTIICEINNFKIFI
jgi:hypothetical protein